MLELTYGKRTIILTGDAEFDAWKNILNQYSEIQEGENEPIKIDIFKVPHHGGKCGEYLSKSFKNDEKDKEEEEKTFEKILRYKFAVISVSSRNTYDHPNSVTREKIMENTKIKEKLYRFYRTDDLDPKP